MGEGYAHRREWVGELGSSRNIFGVSEPLCYHFRTCGLLLTPDIAQLALLLHLLRPVLKHLSQPRSGAQEVNPPGARNLPKKFSFKDQLIVPKVPDGNYLLSWRWDARGSPQVSYLWFMPPGRWLQPAWL
jgi:hypothetical protein